MFSALTAMRKGSLVMTEIKKAEDLVAVSIRQGLQMNLVEADIVLGYM